MIESSLSQKNTLEKPCIELDESRFIAFETEETFLFPYLSLRMVRYRDLNRPEEEGQIDLTFDQAMIQIVGIRLKLLLPEIQREQLFLVRIGICQDWEAPQIKRIQVNLLESDEEKCF